MTMAPRAFANSFRSFLSLAVLAAAALAVPLAISDDTDRKAKDLLLDRRYAEAAELLAKEPGQGAALADRLFLRGHAFLLAGDAPKAIAAFESYTRDYPKGADAPRARLGVAAAKRIQKDFAGAASIDREQLRALLDPARRSQLSKVYLEFAEKAEKATPPDWKRALTFYDLAVSLELPKGEDEKYRSKAAEMLEKQSDFAGALQRLLAVKAEHGDGAAGETRFRIAALRRATGDPRGARRAYQDFLRDFPASPRAPEAAHGIALTWGIPAPADDDSLARGVAALRELIAKYPQSEDARGAGFEIAESEFQRGRFEEAIRDYQAFISSAGKDDPASRVAAARAKVGDAWFAQARFTDAIAAWQLYLKEHPTHGEFARVHRAIVDAEHAIAAVAAREALESVAKAKEKGDAAREVIQRFLAAHPLDPRQAATTLLLAAIEERRERYEAAREEFEKAASKFANTNEASEAQYHVGRLYEERTFDFQKAIEAYGRVQGAFRDRALQRIAELQRKDLGVVTKRTWRGDEEPSVEITSRNIEKMRLRIYRLDLETFFRAKLAVPAIESLDVEVIEADTKRDVAIEPYVAHQRTTKTIALPECKGKAGAFLVKADDGELEATSLVLVSDLVLVTKASRRNALVFAQDARTGEPVAGVRLVVSDGAKVLFEEATGKDGVWLKSDPAFEKVQRLAVYGSATGGAAVTGLDLSALGQPAALTPRCLVVLDRSSYRPGEVVRSWALARGVRNGSYAIDEGRKLRIALQDPSGLTLRTIDTTISPFGTARSDFEIPSSAGFGNYTVAVFDAGLDGSAALGTAVCVVEEVRTDRLRVEVTPENPVVMRGEALKGTVKASYFSGGSAGKRSLQIAVSGLDLISVTTDDDGKANFSFDTRELNEEGTYAVSAALAEEGIAAAAPVYLATVEFRPSLKLARRVVLAGEAFDLAIETKNVAGKAVRADLTISILRQEDRGLQKVGEQRASTDKDSGKATARVSIEKGGRYVLRAEAKDRFGSAVSADAGIEVSGDDDSQKIRILVDRDSWKLGETIPARVVSRLSAERTMLVCHEGSGILGYRIVKIPKGESRLEVALEEQLAPQFTLALAAVDDWRLHEASKLFTVTKDLRVAVAAPKDPLAPGSEASLEVRVTDARGNPVSAEVLLSAIDAAFLAKRPDGTPDLAEFFFSASREAGTTAASSCAFVYNARTRNVARDLAAEEERMRTILESRAFAVLSPELKPDADRLVDSMEVAREQLASIGYIRSEEKRGGDGKARPPATAGKPRSSPGPAAPIAGNMGLSSRGAASRFKVDDFSVLPSKGGGGGESGGLEWYGGLAVHRDPNESADSTEPVSPLRFDFRATAGFEVIATDREGKGIAKFRLPDSTTEWVATARGATKATELGSGDAKFLTRRDLEVSLRAPGSFAETDRIDGIGLVRNVSGGRRDVSVSLGIDGGAGGATSSLTLAEGEERVVGGSLTIGAADRVRLTLEASGGGAADAIRREIGVRPAGIVVSDAAGAVVRDEAMIELELADFAKLRNPSLTLTIGPTLEASVLEDPQDFIFRDRKIGSAWLTDTAGWTVTRGVSALERLAFLGRAGLANETAIARERRRVADAVARLIAEQLADGSFGWSGAKNTAVSPQQNVTRTSDLATTARALAFLARARGNGFAVADAAYAKLQGWVLGRLRAEESPLERARILLALAEAGAIDAEPVNRLQRAKADLPDTGLALLVLTHLRMGRKDLASEVAADLRKRAREGDGGVGFGSVPAPGTDASEATGLAALALARVEANDPLVPRLMDALRSERLHRLSDRAEAAALAALATYFGSAKPASSAYELTIALNGETIRSLKSADLLAPMAVTIHGEKLKAKNTVKLSLKGRGDAAIDAFFSGILPGFDAAARRRYAVVNRTVEPAPLMFRGRTIPRGFGVVDGPYNTFTNEVKNLPVGVEAEVSVSFGTQEKEAQLLDYAILEDPIPAGCEVVPGSIVGSFERVTVRDGAVVAAFGSRSRSGWMRYRLLGSRPGDYLEAPAVVRSTYHPDRAADSKEKRLVVLPSGTPSPDERRLTPDELYHFGVARYDAGERKEGAELLRKALSEWRLRDEPMREASRRVLLEAIERNDSPEAIAAFERLRDRFPEVTLPFETVAKVGDAYVAANQAEVADLVFRGTMGALFRREANVAGSLLRQGEFVAAVKFLEDLHRIYPDLPEILTALHQLSGLVGSTALEKTVKGADGKPITRDSLLAKAGELELEFLVRAPEDPQAPEAGFGILSAELDRGRYAGVVEGCAAFGRRYQQSELLDQVLFLEGYARFASGDAKAALEALARLTTDSFPNGRGGTQQSSMRDRAIFLRGQILHATGDARGAIGEYEKVKTLFADAADALASFRRKALSLPPSVTVNGNDPAELAVTSRNLKKGDLRIYRVDLMRLYLMERNLDRMTGIDLAGIAPMITKEVTIGTGEDYTDRETKLPLELPEKGAYLVVLRSSAESGVEPLSAASLVLRTDLKMEVREDAAAGRVWINVRDAKGASVPRADVRVVGTDDASVRVGATDLRGVYVAEGIHGRTTVVVQTASGDKSAPKASSFAFYKGLLALGAPKQQDANKDKEARKQTDLDESFEASNTSEFRRNNSLFQTRNRAALEDSLQRQQQGVELQRVK